MAKVLRAGNVKTRLQPVFSAEQWLTLAEAFLFSGVKKPHRLCNRLVIDFAPVSEKDYLEPVHKSSRSDANEFSQGFKAKFMKG